MPTRRGKSAWHHVHSMRHWCTWQNLFESLFCVCTWASEIKCVGAEVALHYTADGPGLAAVRDALEPRMQLNAHDLPTHQLLHKYFPLVVLRLIKDS